MLLRSPSEATQKNILAVSWSKYLLRGGGGARVDTGYNGSAAGFSSWNAICLLHVRRDIPSLMRSAATARPIECP